MGIILIKLALGIGCLGGLAICAITVVSAITGQITEGMGKWVMGIFGGTLIVLIGLVMSVIVSDYLTIP